MSVITPDIAERYLRSVEIATANIVRMWPGIFDFEDIEAEAWEIAANRWYIRETKGPDPQAYATTDLRQQLSNRVRKMLREHGWSKTKEGWKRPPDRVIPVDPERFARWVIRTPWDEDDGNSTWFVLDWAPMTRRQARRFGGILMDNYPELCAAFWALEIQAKPARLSWTQFSQRQEAERARLRYGSCSSL